MTPLEILGRIIGVLAFGMVVLSLWQDLKARERERQENNHGR